MEDSKTKTTRGGGEQEEEGSTREGGEEGDLGGISGVTSQP